MTDLNTKSDMKDETVTQYFEHSGDRQGEVLETRYAGENPNVVSINWLHADVSRPWTLGHRQDLLEGHAFLHGSQLGSSQ